jgi:hypothetical protein
MWWREGSGGAKNELAEGAKSREKLGEGEGLRDMELVGRYSNRSVRRSSLVSDDFEVGHHAHRVVLEDVAVVHPLARTIVR